MQERAKTFLSSTKVRGLALGGLIGAVVGVATAWLLMTSPREHPKGRGRGGEFGAVEALRLIVSFLKLVQRLAEWL
ncbi:MAG: hypothetical protein DRI61_13675 [Chloroflexi bacterium]|nr:MAG: hypothetical protein DRI61_13675 [Chloroflexota bacterium]HDN80900.1 hypothetical protein [Chloroflexota bacterium]